MDHWQTILSRGELVTLPAVYLRLREVLDDPDAGFAEIGKVIGSDPAASARLLRVVNSAYFGLGRPIASVPVAVGLLGRQQVHDLVLATSVARSFDGLSIAVMDVGRFWERSVRCGIVARELALLRGLLDAEHLFILGLLHDLGHLFMYQALPTLAEQALSQARQEDEPLRTVEQRLFGFDAATAGARMMQRWRLPESLWQPILHRHDASQAGEHAAGAAILQLACLLVDAFECADSPVEALAAVAEADWVFAGIERATCEGVAGRAEAEYQSVLQLFRPMDAVA